MKPFFIIIPFFYPGNVEKATDLLCPLILPFDCLVDNQASTSGRTKLKYFIYYLNYSFASAGYAYYSKLFPFLNLTVGEKKDLFDNLYNEYRGYFNPELTDVSKEYFKGFVTFINNLKNDHFSFPLMSLKYFPVDPEIKRVVLGLNNHNPYLADQHDLPENYLEFFFPGHYSHSPLNIFLAL